MSRKRQSNGTPPKNSTQNEPTSFDLWLQRSAHISQAFLTICTLASLYFIVLPIYQKELLTEAIAKKELELSKLQREHEAFRATDSKNRVFVILGSMKIHCRFKVYGLDEPSPSMRERLNEDFGLCWKNQVRAFNSLDRLTPSDRKELQQDIDSTIPIIKAEQLRVIDEYENFKAPPPDFKPTRHALSDHLEQLGEAMGISKYEIEKSRKESLYKQARDDIGWKFQTFVDNEADKIVKKWSAK